MAINRYFDHLYNTSEQDMFIDIVQEAIQIHGSNIYYIVRDMENMDDLLREEKLSVFRTVYEIEAYVNNVGSNATFQQYMHKFGFRFEESNEIIVSAKSWDALGTGFPQPRAGDYIYVGNPEDQYGSFINCMFQVNSVIDGYDGQSMQFGSIAAFKISVSVVNKSYSNIMDTNYTDINDFLNPTEQSENKTTIKKVADEFTDINVVPAGNPFTKFGMK